MIGGLYIDHHYQQSTSTYLSVHYLINSRIIYILEKSKKLPCMKTIFQNLFKWLYLVMIMLFTVVVSAQEICDNGIDDDGDGLIDINDQEDCFCGAVNIDIVNGDFEDYSCCPDNVTFLPDNGIYCLIDGWEPA